jgi:hypothetical protein
MKLQTDYEQEHDHEQDRKMCPIDLRSGLFWRTRGFLISNKRF